MNQMRIQKMWTMPQLSGRDMLTVEISRQRNECHARDVFGFTVNKRDNFIRFSVLRVGCP